MIGRILKFLLGIIFIPLALSASVTLFGQIQGATTLSFLGRNFLAGAGAYAALHLLLFKPTILYVFGHELAHVFACWLCLGGVRSFRVSTKGGGVTTTKNNFFIALAPYYFPAYAVIAALIYLPLSLLAETSYFAGHFIFILGATFAFHLIFTAEFLKTRQPDILQTGYLFSITSIYLANIVILAAILSGLFRGVSFLEFGKTSLIATRDFYETVFAGLFL